MHLAEPKAPLPQNGFGLRRRQTLQRRYLDGIGYRAEIARAALLLRACGLRKLNGTRLIAMISLKRVRRYLIG